jgi:hypothetical protein
MPTPNEAITMCHPRDSAICTRAAMRSPGAASWASKSTTIGTTSSITCKAHGRSTARPVVSNAHAAIRADPGPLSAADARQPLRVAFQKPCQRCLARDVPSDASPSLVLLAAVAEDLATAMRRIRQLAYAILDGTLISIDRVA